MLGEPIRDRKAERHSRTRAEIVSAAWEVARRQGVAGLSLRDVARKVGMRAPSLYTYFSSKNELFDAMFADGNRALLASNQQAQAEVEGLPFPEQLRHLSRRFLDFCLEDPARYILLFQRTIPDFEPSPEAYAIAVEALDNVRKAFVEAGIRDQEALDVYTALMKGLSDQQMSNDPGGDRWTRLLDGVLDMWLARFHQPVPRRRTTRRARKE